MRYCAPVSNGLIEHELVHVFHGEFDGVPDLNLREAMAWCWRAPAEIAEDVQRRPESYTVWFRRYWSEHWHAFAPRSGS